MQQIQENRTSSFTAHDEDKCIRFDSVVSVVDGSSVPTKDGPRRMATRRVSLPLSFTKASPQDLDDPAFTPTPQRKLCIKIPSIKRGVSSAAHSAVGPSSGSNSLRSCLASTSASSSTSPRRKAARRSASSDSHSHEIPATTSSSSSLSSSLPSTSHLASSPPAAPSSFMQHVGSFRRNSNASTNTVASSTLVTTPPAEDGLSPTETLLECCADCYRSVELGWESAWEDAPWSASALRKKDRDERERLEQEREFGRSPGEIGVLQNGRTCSLPGGEEVDGAEVEGLCERAKGVLVDEVSMARRASQVLLEEDESVVPTAAEQVAATSPSTNGPMSRCPFYTRKSSSSSILSLSNQNNTDASGRASPPTTPTVTVTTSSYPSRNAPSTLVHRRTPSGSSLRIPLPSSPLSGDGSRPSSPLAASPSLAAPVWILGGDDDPSATQRAGSPSGSLMFPPSPLSANGDSSPSGLEKGSFFPITISGGVKRQGSPPVPPSSYKPPSPPVESTLQPAATIKPKLQISTFPPSPSSPPTSFMVLPVAVPPRTRSQSNAVSFPPPTATRSRSASVPRPSPPALSPGEQPGKKIKGFWAQLKGGILPSAAAGQVGVRGS